MKKKEQIKYEIEIKQKGECIEMLTVDIEDLEKENKKEYKAIQDMSVSYEKCTKAETNIRLNQSMINSKKSSIKRAQKRIDFLRERLRLASLNI